MQSHSSRLRARRMQNPATCFVCQRTGHFPELVRAGSTRPSIAEHLSRTRGIDWVHEGHVCQHCLAEARHAHLLDRLGAERGRLSELDREVTERIRQRESVVLANEHAEDDERGSTFGERVADSMARGGGSWPFVLGFVALLVVWTGVNGLVLRNQAFDPYPFILLNLVLSCLAALQAPIIMMSQNRAEARDRLRAESDYRVNLKAEIEVAALHDKLDHVLHAQYEEMIELQEAELDLLEQLVSMRNPSEFSEDAVRFPSSPARP